MDAPRTDGTPETGTFGVGARTIMVGSGVGVAVTTIILVGTLVGTIVGIGVAVAAGQTQVNSSGHSGFLQRLMPCTVAHTKPDEHPLSSLHDASQTPGTGGEVGVGVEVGVDVGVSVGVEVDVGVPVSGGGGGGVVGFGGIGVGLSGLQSGPLQGRPVGYAPPSEARCTILVISVVWTT